MFGYYIVNFIRGLLVNILFFILCGLFMAIFIAISPIAQIIIPCAFGLIILIIALILYIKCSDKVYWLFGISRENEFVSQYDISLYNTGEQQKIVGNKAIVKRAASKRPIYACWAYICLIPHLVAAIVCAIYAAKFLNNSGESILPIFLMPIAVFQSVYFLLRLIFYIRSTCFKCGKIFCFVETNSDQKSYMSEFEKDRETSENVGSIYSGGDKIADVYKKGITTDTYVGISSKTTHYCNCLYCRKATVKTTEYVDAWKK